jgi:DNA-binding NarL/FixJ family response regulator
MTRPRLLLADDHAVLLHALGAMLEPEFDIVGMVGDGRSLLELQEKLRPDLVLLDINMPVLNGLDAGRRLRQARPELKLVYLTMSLDPALAGAALRMGASGYVLKTSDGAELKRALREAMEGHAYIAPEIAQDVIASLVENRQGLPKLTTRQREVLQLLAEGRSMKEAAAILGVATRTVAFHKYRMMHQLHVRSSAELVQYAVRNGLIA